MKKTIIKIGSVFTYLGIGMVGVGILCGTLIKIINAVTGAAEFIIDDETGNFGDFVLIYIVLSIFFLFIGHMIEKLEEYWSR